MSSCHKMSTPSMADAVNDGVQGAGPSVVKQFEAKQLKGSTK
jgi:hypothetical protein